MSFYFVCKYYPSEKSWSCDEELTELGKPGIYESDLHLWKEAPLCLENDRDSYIRVKDGDSVAFKEEMLKHYHMIQKNELERWHKDEDFLRVHGKIGLKKRFR